MINITPIILYVVSSSEKNKYPIIKLNMTEKIFQKQLIIPIDEYDNICV